MLFVPRLRFNESAVMIIAVMVVVVVVVVVVVIHGVQDGNGGVWEGMKEYRGGWWWEGGWCVLEKRGRGEEGVRVGERGGERREG